MFETNTYILFADIWNFFYLNLNYFFIFLKYFKKYLLYQKRLIFIIIKNNYRKFRIFKKL